MAVARTGEDLTAGKILAIQGNWGLHIGVNPIQFIAPLGA